MRGEDLAVVAGGRFYVADFARGIAPGGIDDRVEMVFVHGGEDDIPEFDFERMVVEIEARAGIFSGAGFGMKRFLEIVFDVRKIQAGVEDFLQRVIGRVFPVRVQVGVEVGLKVAAPDVVGEFLEIGDDDGVDDLRALGFQIGNGFFG